ncbi:MAG TPA: hypothetical protein VKP30_24555, partial [Polyangiaceae bacterium]|nr:hypothetical protein [Polyangiaceae bacterium]
VVDEEFEKVRKQPVDAEEIARALSRIELGLLASLDTVDGKASTIGFYETLLGRPAAAFERLELMQRVDASDLLRVARRYLSSEARTVILVRRSGNSSNNGQHEGAQ